MRWVIWTLSVPTASYRFTVLLFNCLLTFGSYFCFDIPSVLQEQFQGVSAGRSSGLWYGSRVGKTRPNQPWSLVAFQNVLLTVAV